MCAALLACGAPPTPEDRLREMLVSAQSAVNERDAGALRDLISEDFSDDRGHTKEDIGRIIAAQMLRSSSLYAHLHVDELDVDNGAATGVVLAGLARLPAGVPAPEGLEQWSRLRADVIRFELAFRDEPDGWRVTSAHWRRAGLDDLKLGS